MSATISENWILFLMLLVILVAVIWWLFSRGGSDSARRDVPPPAGKTLEVPPKTVAPLSDAPKVSEPPKAEEIAVKKAVAPKAKAKPAAPKTKPAAPKAAPAKDKAKAPSPAPAKPKKTPLEKAAPKAKASPKAAVADNLEQLKGVGPKLNTLLKSLGVTGFEQIANWSPADIREIDSKLGTFAGRIGRDNWVDQATLLSEGDIAGFEKKYGALGVEIK